MKFGVCSVLCLKQITKTQTVTKRPIYRNYRKKYNDKLVTITPTQPAFSHCKLKIQCDQNTNMSTRTMK